MLYGTCYAAAPRQRMHVHTYTSPARRNLRSYSSTAFGGRVAVKFSIHSYLTSPASSAVMHFAASGEVRPASVRSRRDVRWCLDKVGWQRHRVSQPRAVVVFLMVPQRSPVTCARINQ